jgi:hypothetical protein
MTGAIAATEAQRLADRLSELLVPTRWQVVTEKFIAACRLAACRREALLFTYNPHATIARLIADALREQGHSVH